MNRSLPVIGVVGTGYVGLCTAVGFASRGFKVITSTSDKLKADLINSGEPPFYEPGLKELLSEAVALGNLRCTLDREETVLESDVTFITVGTPSLQDGSIDLSLVEASARDIGKALARKNKYHIVVVKSTVIPGTTVNLVKPTIEELSGKRAGIDFGLAMNPEFLREGSALYDTFNPDRVVIGEFDKRSGDVLEELYNSFYSGKVPIIRTNPFTAELIKYANNAFLALKISFINTIANICERVPDADVRDVAKAIGMDRRISPLFLNAGVGFGGSCFPKDLKALIAYSKKEGYEPTLLQEVLRVNERQAIWIVDTAERKLGNLSGKVVAVLGLAFKPGTDDMREAPSIRIVKELLRRGAYVKAYDPAAIGNARKIFGDKVKLCESIVDCIRGSDCCMIVTEWDEFKDLAPSFFKENMRRPFIIDGRRIYDPKLFRSELEFEAVGLGGRST